jgi:hypothetical protein
MSILIYSLWVCSFLGLGYSFIKWRALSATPPSDDLSISEKIQRFNIPVLGAPQSGKTQLIACLGEALSSINLTERRMTPPPTGQDEATEPTRLSFTTRLLTIQEEQRERGLKLESVDPERLRQGQHGENKPPRPGFRTTEALIRMERHAFLTTGSNPSTRESEDAYFQVLFSSNNMEKSPIICAFRDVPGGHFSGEEEHEANITPLLETAQGVVLVVDGLKVSLSGDQIPSEYLLYQKVLEQLLEDQHMRLPVWVVITKADLLPIADRDEERWRSYILRHIAPQLRLTHQEAPFEISLVSADPKCVESWGAILSEGSLFISHLQSVLETYRERRRQWSERADMLKRRWSLCLLLASLISWPVWDRYQVDQLPALQGEISWDWDSLDSASKPHLDYLKGARSLFKTPLFKEPATRGLHLLRRSYLQHAHGVQLEWGRQLEREGIDPEMSPKRHERTSREGLKALKAFHGAFTSLFLRSLEEKSMIDSLETMIDHIDQARRIQRNQSITFESAKERIERLRILTDSWKHRCHVDKQQTSPQKRGAVASCLVQTALSRVKLEIIERALKIAIESSQSATNNREPPVYPLLKLLIEWRGVSQGLSAQHLLRIEHQQAVKRAWMKSWAYSESLFRQEWSAGKESLRRLKYLKEFDHHRRLLGGVSREGAVIYPEEIAKSWSDTFGRECVKLHEGLGVQLDVGDKREAKEICEWAEPYLAPPPFARVKYKATELKWREELKASLTLLTPDRFDQTLTSIGLDLDNLDSLSGAGAIKEETKKWRDRLLALKQWRARSKTSITLDILRCDSDEMVRSGDKGIWDDFKVYLVVKVNEETSIHDDDEETWTVMWAPWSLIKLSLYEKDYKRDDPPGSDDDVELFSQEFTSPLGVQGLPTPLLKGCDIKFSMDRTPPKWLSEEGILL